MFNIGILRNNRLKKQTNTKPSILIVDDDKDDHFLIKRALSKIIPEASITSVYDGSEAMDYLLKKGHFEENSDRAPDLIFLDINMPKMNGKNTTALIKRDKVLKEIPIVIFTTSSNPTDQEQLLKLGADDYHVKPYDINQFIQILESVTHRWLTTSCLACVIGILPLS